MTDVIGTEQVAKATALLQRYKTGKAALDKRLIDNELWFRMGHWKNYRDPLMPGKAQPSSGWLFNSIANKHADAMDNYPEPMVLPRAADDQATAQALSSVLPVVLEQADYEQVYSDVWWRKLKQGTGVTGIFWDPAARGGLGDIAVRSVNLLMLYWEPGVQDIQDSPDLFHLSLEDTARLTAQYPQLAGHAAGVVDVPRYIHEDGQTTANKSVVVDWYYKRPDENGKLRLHYCKLCNGVVLYASQNDPALAARGLYDHGKYPFVFYFHPKDVKELRYITRRDAFTYPVCIDEKDDFNALNRFPGEMTFQSFLLNRENKVIAIGNPVYNPKVKELYLQRLTNGKMPSSSVAMTDVSVNTANMDFGTFPQSEKQEYKFVLTNEGNNLLVIQDVTTSCGCTKVSYSKEPVRSGASLELTVTYEAEEKGHFNKMITVYCNTKASPLRLMIAGNAK